MPRRVQVAMVATHFGVTGIGSVIMNYCKALDPNKYEFTVIAGLPIAEQYKKECEQYGIHIIVLPPRHEQSFRHYTRLLKVLKTHHFDIFHDHGNSSMMAVELTLARFAGIKIRIAHSHNTRCSNATIHKLLNPYFRKQYTKALACGRKAGDWLYGEGKFTVLPNGFNTNDFQFSLEDRSRIRKELNIDDKLVIGHMGRINDQKNQDFLIDVFNEVAREKKDAVLLLVGEGPCMKAIQHKASESAYKDRIIFYGVSSKPSEMYSAMDILTLPSKYEGLPVVLLEAQISGLPCIVSDRVTREVDFGRIKWASIENVTEWKNKILSTQSNSILYRTNYLKDHKDLIEQYDIKNTVGQLDDIYSSLLREEI